MQENKRENSIIKKRILEFLSKIDTSKYECYQKTGISRSVLSQPNGMTEDNLLKFLAYYKDVNPTWLITGQGEMLLSDDKKSNNKSDDDINWKEKHHDLSMELNDCRKTIDHLRIENHRLQLELNELQGNEEPTANISVTKKNVKHA